MTEIIEESINVEKKEGDQYFSVATPKLILMSVCSMGIYELYWFYKNFVYIKRKTNSDISPFWRAFFAPLWSYSVFHSIERKLIRENISVFMPSAFLAISYFILQALWRLPDPYWILSALSFLPLLIANSAVTKINEKVIEDFQQNSRIQGWNWLVVILGGLVFLLAILGAFMPDPT